MLQIDPELLQHATPEELAELEKALEIETALQSPLALAEYTSEAEHYLHLEYIDSIIVAMFDHRLYKSGIGPKAIQVGKRKWVHPETGEKVVTKVMIKCPPRHGKSFLISHHLPAWFLSRYPERRVILASYEADFAAEWGEKVRDLIEEHPELGITVNKDNRSKANWRVEGTNNGGMTSAGAGGAVTGKGAGLLINDDPIKNSEEAMSPVERNNKDNWYKSVFRTRGNRKGDVIPYEVFMYTPWHEDDLGNRILEREPENWFEIVLPALAYEDADEDGVSLDEERDVRDPLGRKPGEALCPDLATRDELLELEAGVGKSWFTAMYQCKPNIQGGGIFKREAFRRYTKMDGVYELYGENEIIHVPENDIRFRFGIGDYAATTKTRSDFTAIGVFAVTKRKQLILEQVYRRRLESPDHEAFTMDIYVKHKLKFFGIEDQTYGKSLIQHLIRRGGIVVRKLQADADKVARAIPVGDVLNNGQIYIPKESDWVEAFIDELVKFNNGAHDDQVDMFTYGVREWEKIPALRSSAVEDTSMEARVRRQIENMGKKRHPKHIDLY